MEIKDYKVFLWKTFGNKKDYKVKQCKKIGNFFTYKPNKQTKLETFSLTNQTVKKNWNLFHLQTK